MQTLAPRASLRILAQSSLTKKLRRKLQHLSATSLVISPQSFKDSKVTVNLTKKAQASTLHLLAQILGKPWLLSAPGPNRNKASKAEVGQSHTAPTKKPLRERALSDAHLGPSPRN